MKKEHYRDYATAAYRIRARLGSAREYAAKIWDQAMAHNLLRLPGLKWGRDMHDYCRRTQDHDYARHGARVLRCAGR